MKSSTVAKAEFMAITAVAAVHASPLPFVETFDTLNDGALDAQNGWVLCEGTAVVQTNTSAAFYIDTTNTNTPAGFYRIDVGL